VRYLEKTSLWITPKMMSGRRKQIVALMAMVTAIIGLGIWLILADFVGLGCFFVAVFLWRLQQLAIWLIAPEKAPSVTSQPITSKWHRLLLSVICIVAAGVCSLGIYLWWWWPEQWQAGLVVILFGLAVLAPVTVQEIRFRKRLISHFQYPDSN
jgi:hypothetical protein